MMLKYLNILFINVHKLIIGFSQVNIMAIVPMRTLNNHLNYTTGYIVF